MSPDESSKESGLDVLALAIILARHQRLLLRLPLVGAAIVVGLSFLLPNTYLGVSRIVPPQSQSLSAQILSQIGVASLAGVVPANPGLLYVGMLQGTTIADKIIDRFELTKRYKAWHGGVRTRMDVRQELARRTNIALTPEGLITISVRDRDPTTAAQIANAYVDEFKLLRRVIENARATDRVEFFEKQVIAAKQSLSAAELGLKQTQERTGLLALEGQGTATIEASALLRAQLVAKEVELESTRLFSTVNNPIYKKQIEELAALRRELAKLEGKGSREKGDLLLSPSKLPENALEYARKVREVKYSEILVELLSRQYELAKLEQAQDFTSVDVIDRATPPDSIHGPNRPLIGIAAYLLCLLFAMVSVLVYEWHARLLNHPERSDNARQLAELLRPHGLAAKLLGPSMRVIRRMIT